MSEAGGVVPEEMMKRPSWSDDFVKARAAELYKPVLERYLRPEWSEREWPSLKKDIDSHAGPHEDGYSVARRLEQHGWAEDRELIDVMDQVVDCCEKALAELVWQWVRCYKPAMPFGVGDPVTARFHGTGTVIKVLPESATYHVNFPDIPPTAWRTFEAEKLTAPVAVEAVAA